MAKPRQPDPIVERVQTGVRIERRLLKVLKGLAEYHDMSLGDLVLYSASDPIVEPHAFV